MRKLQACWPRACDHRRCLVVVALATARPGDRALYPPADPSYARILVTHNGYHSGVLLPRAAVAELAGRRAMARSSR